MPSSPTRGFDPIHRSRAATMAAAAWLLLELTPARADAQAVGESPGTIRGTVVDREGESPLRYAVISLSPAAAERFVDDSGRFVFTSLTPGTYQLRARQLGFSPLDSTVVISEPGQTLTVQLRLAPIVLRLAGVRVTAKPLCLHPGPPDPTSDPEIRTIFDQLRENAARYQLLAAAYPFRYQVERSFMLSDRGAQVTSVRIDTMTLDSRNRWRYAPGKMVVREPGPRGTSELALQLPTLPVFADSIFHQHHCFGYGGMETVEGRQYLRMNFEAAARMKEPDVSGAVWLDPESYQIRRAHFRLTRPPREIRGLKTLSATTTYREVLPAVVIIDQVSALTTLVAHRRLSTARMAEEQRLLSFSFVGADSVPR